VAVTEMRTLNPRLPNFRDLDWRRFSLDLDRLSDTLYWDFYGEPRPSVSFPLNDHVLLSVDPESEAVVGFQLDGFLAHLVYEVPAFLELSDLIGLSPDEVRDIRERIEPDQRRRAVMELIFGSIAPHDPELVGAR
jgi:hypothetical protein